MRTACSSVRSSRPRRPTSRMMRCRSAIIPERPSRRWQRMDRMSETETCSAHGTMWSAQRRAQRPLSYRQISLITSKISLRLRHSASSIIPGMTNMMNISDSSIEASFLGAEKGLALNGVEPLDSYVVDDGWNNYNNEIGGVNAPAASGTTQNQTGFWNSTVSFLTSCIPRPS